MTINFRDTPATTSVDGAIQYEGVDVVSYNATGIVYAPKNFPAFAGRLGTIQNNAATLNKVKLTGLEFNTLFCWDEINNRFIPNVAGYYYVTGSISAWGGNGLCAIIYKNGTSYLSGNWFNGVGQLYSKNYTAQVNGIVYLNGTTDYIELWGSHSASLSYSEWTLWTPGATFRVCRVF